MHAQHLTAAGPLALETADYLAFKRKRLTPASQRGYAAALAELARCYPARELAEFEPPAGTALLEDFLSSRWGGGAARTYNKNLSIIHDFFEWQVRRGRLAGDPTLPIERARGRAVHRTTFDTAQRTAILHANPGGREQVALRLLLDYGIRKGALQGIRLEHFDPTACRLVVFTKGEKIHQLPLPDETIWQQLARLEEPGRHYLLPRQALRRRRSPRRRELAQLRDLLAQAVELASAIAEDDGCALEAQQLAAALAEAQALLERATASASVQVRRFPDEPMGEHGLHDWWYRCLARAGIVPDGVTRGERMHKARHSAGQRVLDTTGNLKAVQKLLGHASIRTTADEYLDWDLDRLADTMRDVLGARDLDETLLRRANTWEAM